jgi:hypothetical protein
MSETEMKVRLIQGWDWLGRHPEDSAQKWSFYDRWLALLDIYEDRYGSAWRFLKP